MHHLPQLKNDHESRYSSSSRPIKTIKKLYKEGESQQEAPKKKFPAKNGKKESSKPKTKQTAPPVDNDYEEEVNIPVAYNKIRSKIESIVVNADKGSDTAKDVRKKDWMGIDLAKNKNFIRLSSLMS
eukprot:scaffold8658_cov67-Skeletonema_dohrnii-CCMP3373.AAC.1